MQNGNSNQALGLDASSAKARVDAQGSATILLGTPGLLLLGLPLLCCLKSAGFFWTDVVEIQEHALARTSVRELANALAHGIEGHYYRPLVFLLHSLDLMVFGEAPLAFRLTNLLLHLVNVWLVQRLAHELSGNRGVALSTAALFAVHPLALTTIAWVSDRSDLLALLGSLASSVAAARYWKTGSRAALCAVGLALVVGLAGKETAASTVLVSAALVAYHGPKRPLVKTLATQLGVAVVWFVFKSTVATIPALRANELDLPERLALASAIHWEYARELLVPASLSVCDGSPVPQAIGGWILAGVVALCLLASVVRRAWQRNDRVALAALAWLIACLVPTSGLLPLKHVRADRYLYCALPGILLLLVWSGRSFARRFAPRLAARSCAALFAACYLYLSVSLVLRTRHFSGDLALWGYETAHSSACLEGHGYLARAALLEGRLSDVLREADLVLHQTAHAVAFRPVAQALFYRASALLGRGDLANAQASFRALLESSAPRPVQAEAAYSLALIQLLHSRFEAMLPYLDFALQRTASPKTLGDSLLLRSYANLRLSRPLESERDLTSYVQNSEHTQSKLRTAMISEIRSGLSSFGASRLALEAK